ncbi:MAG: DUF512 domain-containing protein [Calditrichia bacterium]
MVKIIDIEPESIAAELGIKPGAQLLEINGKKIRDNLDYRFYCAGEELEILIEQDGEQILFEVEKDYQDDLRLVLEDLTMRKCGNKCVFCFVHQNPKGLRRPLYFKDEDYRFSFLYGHYVTLTNTTQEDLDRIVEQRLTPLYISVHVTDPDLRKYMLGIKFDDFLLEKIDFLTSNGIELHAQIVLCPDLNDGEYLERTLNDLAQFYPGVRSVAIVPVGLTRHRRNLPALKPVDDAYSLQLMEWINKRRERFRKQLDTSFVYLSDEFFIRTGSPIPDDDYYEGFYQLENGVGLTRDLINRFQEELPELKLPVPEMHLTLATGVLGHKVLERFIVPGLDKLDGMRVQTRKIINHFFGESVVVSGLLVGQDLYQGLRDQELGDYVILPPRVLNHDGVFLDDWTVDQLEEKLGKPVIIFPEDFTTLFEIIAAQNRLEAEDARLLRHRGAEVYRVEHMKGGEEWLFAD